MPADGTVKEIDTGNGSNDGLGLWLGNTDKLLGGAPVAPV